MLCPACDSPNDDGARFCLHCGTPLGQAEPAARTGATQLLASQPRCLSCGRENPRGARYCVYCAARLEQQAVGGGALVPAAGIAAPLSSRPFPALAGDPLQLALRAVWFVLVGWWLGLLWTLLAWVFNLTIVGLPLGAMMLNAIPQVMTLQRTRRARPARRSDRQLDHPLVLRALWFLLIGIWASLLWMLLAWALSATIVLLPIGFWMFDRVPTITTLAQEP